MLQRDWTVLTLYLALPSLAMFERLLAVLGPTLSGELWSDYQGPLRALVLTGFTLALLLGGQRVLRALDRQAAGAGLGAVRIWAVTAFVCVCLALAVVYPIVDSGRLGFASDRDEALDVGVHALLAGENPYHCRVISGEHSACLDRGNPIGPFPGALLLAAPFVALLGSSVYQSAFWLAALFFAARVQLGGSGHALVLTAGLFLAAPVLAAELISGGDLMATAIWVALGTWALARRPRLDTAGVGLALLLGALLASRGHFALVGPAVVAFAWRHWSARQAVTTGALIAVGFGAVSLPLFLADPSHFGPLLVQQKLKDFGPDWVQSAVIAVSASVALAGGWRSPDVAGLLRACALVVAVPVLTAVGLYSVHRGGLDFAFYGWYGISSVFFAALGYWQAAVTGAAATPAPPRAESLARQPA